MLAYDPAKRVSARDALNHPFFNELRHPQPAASAPAAVHQQSQQVAQPPIHGGLLQHHMAIPPGTGGAGGRML